MRIWKTGGETYTLMKSNTTLVTDKENCTRKDLRLNPFKENPRNGIGLIHKLLQKEGKNLSRFPVGG